MAWYQRWTRRWQRFRSSLPVVRSLAVIFLLFGLDIRDAMYKLAWVGPADSFHFRAGSTLQLREEPVEPAGLASLTTSTPLESGWPSLLSRCEAITPFCAPGGTFFLSALLSNCTLDRTTTSTTSLVMVANVRVDAVAWASCTLLFVSRRPPICQEEIVAGFHRRYGSTAAEISASWMAGVDSAAERELLEFLELASLSVPLHSVVCGEAFEMDPKALERGEVHEFVPRLYVCASPNQHRSEFVGAAHPAVHFLLEDKAWLTADVLQFMSLHWTIRQNARSRFFLSVDDMTGHWQLTTRTSMNFSSFGQIYAVLAVVDVLLMILHFLSSLEILAWALRPTARRFRNSRVVQRLSSIRGKMAQLGEKKSSRTRTASLNASAEPPPPRTPQEDANDLLDGELFYSFFSRSLYRSPEIVAATCISQLLSWLLVLPNSVVWTWSDSIMEKLQAFLSSIRVWVLLLLLVNGVWSFFVLVQEAHAYRIARSTYLTTVELLGLGALVAFTLRHEVFAMCERKWALERQRLNDLSSFPGFLAHSNSFNPALDALVITPGDVFWVQYSPLVHILSSSFAVVVLYAVLKAFYLPRRGCLSSCFRCYRQCRGASSIVVAESSRQTQQTDKRSTTSSSSCNYERTDLETLLNCPVRAKCLIRNSLELETLDNDGRPQVASSCALDFGVMVRDGLARSRTCFSRVFIETHKHVSPRYIYETLEDDTVVGTTPAIFLRHRSSVSRSSMRDLVAAMPTTQPGTSRPLDASAPDATT